MTMDGTANPMLMSGIPTMSERDRSLALMAVRRSCGADASLVAGMLGLA